MERVCQTLGVSERRACRVLRQYRSTQRHRTLTPQDEPRLVTRTLQLAGEYGRYGYRRITALLRREGWRVLHALMVHRIVEREVSRRVSQWRDLLHLAGSEGVD